MQPRLHTENSRCDQRFSGVIIPKHRAVGYSPVVTTATGAIEHVPIARVAN